MARKKSDSEREVDTRRVTVTGGAGAPRTEIQTKKKAAATVAAGKLTKQNRDSASAKAKAKADALADLGNTDYASVKRSADAILEGSREERTRAPRVEAIPPVRYREATPGETQALKLHAAAFQSGGPRQEEHRAFVAKALQGGLHKLADSVELPCLGKSGCNNTVKWGDGDVICPGCAKGDKGSNFGEPAVVASSGGAGGRAEKGTGRGGRGSR